MARLMEFGDDWRGGYVELCKQVKYYGLSRPSRVGDVHEIRDFVFTLSPHALDLPLGVGRGLHLSLAAAEALQLCAGVGMPELTEAASRQVAQYVRDPDGTVHGNYGARVGTQIRDVVEKLEASRDNRQAVIQVWDASKDSQFRLPMPKDIPCTLSITLGTTGIRDALTMSVVMRSSDVWLGIPYDVFQFRQLQRTIARLVNVEVGEYTHHSVSMHAYVRDHEAITGLDCGIGFRPPLSWRDHGPDGLHAGRAKDLPEVFRDVLNGHDLHCGSHRWYHERLGAAAHAASLG